jgi:hypothetical protein
MHEKIDRLRFAQMDVIDNKNVAHARLRVIDNVKRVP